MIWQRHMVAGLAYVGLVLMMTWPVGMQIGSHVAGQGGDAWQTMWRFAAKAELFAESAVGPAPRGVQGAQDFALREFLGGGEPRLVNLSVWPWMGLHALFGQPVAYNLVWLLSFILSGYGMYLLVRYLVTQFGGIEGFQTDMAAFVAGVYYMFLPYHMSHAMGHFGAMQLQWLPLIILAGTAWVVRPQWWKALVLAILFIFQAWTEHHYFLWLTVFGAIAGIFWVIYLRSYQGNTSNAKFQISQLRPRATLGEVNFKKRTWWLSGVVFVLAVILITFSYLPTIRFAFQDTAPLDLGKEQLIRFSADVFAFVAPSPWHPVWGGAAREYFTNHFTGNIAEAVQFLGWVPLLLVLFFHQKIPKYPKWFWFAVALVFFVISLGPRLHMFGRVTSLPLPYELVDEWPVISSVRAVARAGIFVGLAMSVLLGWVLATQLKRKQNGLLVLGVILFEFAVWPVPMQSAAVPEVYRRLQSMPGEAVVEVPAATNYTIASRALYGSGIHGKEVLGNIALERAQSSDSFDLAKRLPAVRQLLYLRTTDLREGRNEFFDQELAESLADVAEWLDMPAIVIHPDSLTALQAASLRRFLEGEAGLVPEQVEDVLLYDVTNWPQAMGHDGIFVMRGERFDHVGFDQERDSVFAEVEEVAELVIVNTDEQSKQVVFAWRIPEESQGTGVVVYQSQEITSLTAGVDVVQFEVTVEPGESVLRFVSEDAGKIILQNPRFEVL